MGFQWDIGVSMLSEYDADGFLSLQVDAEGEQQSGVVSYEAHHFHGFMGRPLDPVLDPGGVPDPSRAPQMLYALEAGRGHSWAMEDPRVIPTLPILKAGETMLYGAAGQFVRCHADGAITLMTTSAGGSASGDAVFMRIKPTGLQFVAPWGTLTFDANGFRIRTTSGAQFGLGPMSGLPGPLSAIGTQANLRGDMISLNGAIVSCGPSASPAFPAVQSVPLQAYLEQIVAGLAIAASGLASTGLAAASAAALAALSAELAVPPPMASSVSVG